jgi:hypothetical protein
MRRDEMCEILIDDDMRKEKKKEKERKGKERKKKMEGKGLTGPKTFVPVGNATRYKYSHLYRVCHPVQMLNLICTRWFILVGYRYK